MSTSRMPLLRTKLHIPPVRTRAEGVSRPRLVERLHHGLGCKLTLVSAPAGFGKTTLLSEWVHGCGAGASTTRVAWLSLDVDDNDPTRFWSYAIAALQTVCAGLGDAALEMLQSAAQGDRSAPSAKDDIESALTALINELTECPAALALVLDDYHLIESPVVHNTLTFLIDHLPAHVHLFIASRVDPPLSLSRLRGRGQLVELRAADLRFTHQEVAAYLNRSMGLALPPEDIDMLEARTEGWIVGLQMAALSLRQRRTQDAGGASEFIRRFAGSNRYVLDYLVQEVLDQQPPGVQRFLLQTSILERLNGSLCDALLEGTGDPEDVGAKAMTPAQDDDGPSGQTALEHLERANLFVVPLDDRREWYRYHQLFADLLRRRLDRTLPDLVPVLHLRASAWYERQAAALGERGLIAEAVSHALAAGDVDRVTELVRENTLPMVYHGELRTLLGWLDALPIETVRARPWLCLARAWVLAYSGELDAVEPLLHDVEAALAQVTPLPGKRALDAGQRDHVAGHVAFIRGYLGVFAPDKAQILPHCRRALALLPEDDLIGRAFASTILGAALGMMDALGEAASTLETAERQARASGDDLLTAMVLSELAVVDRTLGRLHRAFAEAEEALRLAGAYAQRSGQRSPIVGFAYARLSTVLREWNDLETAVRYAEEAIASGERWGQPDSVMIGSAHLVYALASAGDLEGAMSALEKYRTVARALSPVELRRIAAQEAWLRLRQGDVAAASAWAAAWEREQAVEDGPSVYGGEEVRTYARVSLAQGQPGLALRWLVRLQRVEEATGAAYGLVRTLALQAVALAQAGDRPHSLSVLEQALALGEPAGCVRAFVDEGEPVRHLLADLSRARAQAAEAGVSTDYVARLLDAFDQENEPQQAPQAANRVLAAPDLSSVLIEPLTERELEVLALIAEGLTNREIGQRLYISAGTVKAHTASIYGKLDVHNRTQAAARARELGILAARN